MQREQVKILAKTMRLAKSTIAKIAEKLCPVRWKEHNELSYWKTRKKSEGVLSNDHYKYFYTTHFGFDDDDFRGKTILDIGCGPRGSLEWASMASRCIGLDPLAKEYLALGADRHQMEYIDSPSENIPIDDAQCDIVCSFNSLDHVENVEKTLSEIKRVTHPDGFFLLIVDVNHPPTPCEPHKLIPKNLIESLKPEFTCEGIQVYKPNAKGVYNAIRVDEKFSQPLETKEIGYMSAKFKKTKN